VRVQAGSISALGAGQRLRPAIDVPHGAAFNPALARAERGAGGAAVRFRLGKCGLTMKTRLGPSFCAAFEL